MDYKKEDEIKFTLSRKLSKNQNWYYGGSFKLPDGTGYFMNVFESKPKEDGEIYLTVYLNPMNISNEWNKLSKETKVKQEKLKLNKPPRKDETPFEDDDINDLF